MYTKVVVPYILLEMGSLQLHHDNIIYKNMCIIMLYIYIFIYYILSYVSNIIVILNSLS